MPGGFPDSVISTGPAGAGIRVRVAEVEPPSWIRPGAKVKRLTAGAAPKVCPALSAPGEATVGPVQAKLAPTVPVPLN